MSQQAYSILEKRPQRASFERLFAVLATLDVEVVLREKVPHVELKPGEW